MADTSFGSLDVSTLLPEIEVKADPFAEIAEQYRQEEFEKVWAAARWARTQDPQSYARAAELNPEVPPEIGVRQLELLEDSAKLVEYKRVLEASPALRGYFAERPKDLAYANPDELDSLSGIAWAVEAFPAAVAQGWEQAQGMKAGFAVLSGTATPEEAAAFQAYEAAEWRNFGARGGWFAEGLAATGQTLPAMGLMLGGAVAKGAQYGLAGAGAGGLVGGPAGAATGFSLGARVGGTYGAYEQSFQMLSGAAYSEFRKFRDENGEALPDDVAKWAALFAGATGAGLETLGLSGTLGKVPGLDNILGNFTVPGLKGLMANPGVRGAFSRFAANMGSATITEVFTEMGQEALTIFAGEMAKATAEGDFEQIGIGEAAGRIGEAGITTLQVMSILGPVTAGTRFGADMLEVVRSKREREQLEKIAAAVAENPLTERAPQIVKDIVDRQTEGKELYINAEEARTLFQEQGKDLYEAPLPNWRERVDEALRTSGDIVVTVGEYTAYLSRDPKDNPLAAILRTSPEGYSLAETQAATDAQSMLMATEIERARALSAELPGALPEAQQELFPELDALRQQIEEIGFQPQAVQHLTNLFGSFYNTMATRLGVTPSEVFAQHAVELRSYLLYGVKQLSDTALAPVEQATAEGAIQQSLAEGLPDLGEAPAGAITFQRGRAVIQLFEGQDMSTLLHEAGHFFMDVLYQNRERSEGLKADWEAIARAYKIEGEAVSRPQWEKLARAMESYFMEGKAPSPELAGAFAAFKSWLKTLYRTISRLGGKVSPEVRNVFDRLFATEERLDQIAADTAYAPLFKSAEELGLTAEEYIQYQEEVQTLVNEAGDSARRRIVGQVDRFQKGWREEVLRELTAQAEEKLQLQPPYKQLRQMEERKIRLDLPAMQELVAQGRYSPEIIKKIPKKTWLQNGMDPEVAAEILGYSTLDEMLYDIQQAPPIKVAAKELALQELARRMETDYSQGEIRDLAIQQALNQEARLTVLGTELKALNQRAGRQGSEISARQLAMRVAKDAIYRKRVGEVNEKALNAIVRRHARAAETAVVKGDWSAAADAKRKQMLAQAMANEAAVLSTRIQRIRDKAIRYSRKGSQSVHPSYVEQIVAIAEGLEFKNVSGKKLKRRQSLREFIQSEMENDPGQVFLEIPERLLRETELVNYKEISVEDLIDIGDTIDNLEHLGRTKQRMKTAQGQRAFEQVIAEGLAQLRPQKARTGRLSRWAENEKSAGYLMSNVLYATLKPERLMEWLDLKEIGGWFNQNIFQVIADAEVARNDLNAEFSKKVLEAFNEVPASRFQEKVKVSFLQDPLTREEVYAIALNVGNDSNRKKLLEGELWSESQLQEILNHMSKEDWDRVQKIWDILDGLWGKIESLEKRLTGVAPPKIEAREVVTQHGSYRGGYYPVVYDFKARRGMALLEDITPTGPEPGSADIFQPNRFLTPGTSHKHTVKRTKAAKPISRELAVLPKHIHQVVHDLTHREAIRSVYKLLWQPDIKAQIIRIEGESAYRQLQWWLKAVATEYAPETDPVSNVLKKLRTGTTVFTMGYRATTAMAQPLGLFNIARRVSPRHFLGGVMEVIKHPVNSVQMVSDLSGELRHRFNQQDFSIREAVNNLTVGQSKLDKFREYSMVHIAYVDRLVATAGWLGAYSDYLNKHGGDEKLARQHADRVVRLTQGTGNLKDAARVITAGEASRMLTMFYSAFSAIHNEIWDLTRETKRDITEGNIETLVTKRLAEWTMVVFAPAILGALVSNMGPEEDENWAWWATKQVMLYPTVGLPLIRDVASAIESGFDYKFSPAAKVLEQTVRATTKAWDIMTDDGELRDLWKPLATSIGVWYKLPAAQLINTIEAIEKGEAQGDFEVDDLIYGRQGK